MNVIDLQVGEICLSSHSTGTAYWGLEGVSAATFRVCFFDYNELDKALSNAVNLIFRSNRET